MPRGPTTKATFAMRPPFSGAISPPLPGRTYTPAAIMTGAGWRERPASVAHDAAKKAATAPHWRPATLLDRILIRDPTAFANAALGADAPGVTASILARARFEGARPQANWHGAVIGRAGCRLAEAAV